MKFLNELLGLAILRLAAPGRYRTPPFTGMGPKARIATAFSSTDFLDLQLALFLAQGFREQFDAGVDRIDMRRGGLGEPTEFDHGADQGVDLDGAADLDVLQHRSLVFTHLFRAGDAFLQRHPELDAELVRDSLRFGHHVGRELAGKRELADVHQRGMGQGADRVEAQVSPEFEPDLRADVLQHWRLESGLGERRRNGLDAFTFGAIQLAHGETISFNELDNARRGDLGRGKYHAAEDALDLNVGHQRAIRIHCLDPPALKFAAVLLEIPPGNTVLGRDHDGLVVEQAGDLLGDGLDLVRLERQDHDVLLAGLAKLARGLDVARHMFAAILFDQLQAVPAHGLEVRAARNQRDFLAREREFRAHQTADSAGADDADLHG
jgi:hypothetical protein